LRNYPGLIKHLMEPHRWDLWTRLCAERCNTLEIAGYIPNKFALEKFIRDAASAYADVQLKRLGNLKDDESFTQTK
jgi:hypothetical protein